MLAGKDKHIIMNKRARIYNVVGEEEMEALTHCLSLLDSNNEGVNMEMREKE